MNKSLFIITLNLLFNLCFSQNLVKNHSFEEGSCTPDDYYGTATATGQKFNDCLNHWQHCGTRQPLTSHSPDWFSAPAFGGA